MPYSASITATGRYTEWERSWLNRLTDHGLVGHQSPISWTALQVTPTIYRIYQGMAAIQDAASRQLLAVSLHLSTLDRTA